MTTGPQMLDVPVRGGTMRVALWGDRDGRIVLGAHGITANHLNFGVIARHLPPGLALAAPDLRGRGDSAGLPGPWGMATHADDLASIADHLGIDRTVVVGHSMGGYVAAVMAERHPDRVERLVLVDGGLALPAAPGLDVDERLDTILGPSMARLSMTFASPEAYRDMWRQHPALADSWSEDVEAYVDYDLIGDPPELRSKVSKEAVRADGADTLMPGGSAEAITRVKHPAVLLRAERGLLNQPEPLMAPEIVEHVKALSPQLEVEDIPGTNHFTIALADLGARRIAARIASP